MKRRWGGCLGVVLLLAACGGRVDPDATPHDRPGQPYEPNPRLSPAKFFLPTEEPRNTTNPTVELDPQGNLHMVYPAYARGDAYYAYCAGNCGAASQVKVVRLPTVGTVANVMLALSSQGRPHVLMSTLQRVYYASCTGDCTQQTSWTITAILEHQGQREVSGEAFALSPDGKPHFIMHAYRAFLGVGQPAPATYYVSCQGDCHQPGGWRSDKIADQIWQESTLQFTQDGRPRLATVAKVADADGYQEIAAYVACESGCDSEAGWNGIGLTYAYSNSYVEQIDPAVSLALASDGSPRVLALGKNAAGKRNLAYFQCDSNCLADGSWSGGVLVESDQLGAGLDLALDSQDRPRLVYTAGQSVLLAHCDLRCTAQDASWKLMKIELGSDMVADQVIPYPNCTAAAWFLRHPSVAIGAEGLPRIVYRAEDVSGGSSNPDPTKPQCVAGPDMTFARYAQVTALTGN